MTNAEFLNKNFGQNYKQWMKSGWTYSYAKNILVWMVNLDGRKRDGWINILLNDETVLERFVGEESDRLSSHEHVNTSEKRLVVDKIQNHKIIGLFEYNKEKSRENYEHYWIKIADSIDDYFKKGK